MQFSKSRGADDQPLLHMWKGSTTKTVRFIFTIRLRMVSLNNKGARISRKHCCDGGHADEGRQKRARVVKASPACSSRKRRKKGRTHCRLPLVELPDSNTEPNLRVRASSWSISKNTDFDAHRVTISHLPFPHPPLSTNQSR